MPRALRSLLVGALAIATTSCTKTRADVGNDAVLQIEAAQFFRETMPVETSGPKVLSATLIQRIRAGSAAQSCGGELDTAANALAIGLAGDSGYWIVPAKPPNVSAPLSPTYQFVFAIAASAPQGPRDLVLRAVDGEGRFGPGTIRSLDLAAPASPTGRLVVSLRWYNSADLDLHVVLPSGLEIFKRNRTEYQRPPPSAGPVLPGTPTDGGVLDRDSNAGCIPDGQRAENVVWKEPPPAGHYVVRVDTSSLCGDPSAPWRAEAVLDGRQLAAAQGTSTDVDLRFEHNRGGGVLAFEFDVP